MFILCFGHRWSNRWVVGNILWFRGSFFGRTSWRIFFVIFQDTHNWKSSMLVWWESSCLGVCQRRGWIAIGCHGTLTNLDIPRRTGWNPSGFSSSAVRRGICLPSKACQSCLAERCWRWRRIKKNHRLWSNSCLWVWTTSASLEHSTEWPWTRMWKKSWRRSESRSSIICRITSNLIRWQQSTIYSCRVTSGFSRPSRGSAFRSGEMLWWDGYWKTRLHFKRRVYESCCRRYRFTRSQETAKTSSCSSRFSRRSQEVADQASPVLFPHRKWPSQLQPRKSRSRCLVFCSTRRLQKRRRSRSCSGSSSSTWLNF